MPMRKQMATIVAPSAILILIATAWNQSAAQEVPPDAEACLARPTVTCSVELALEASADSHEDHERAELVVDTAYQLHDIGARKAYLDRAAARFFSDSSPADFYLDRERRVIDIVVAAVTGDDETVESRLNEIEDNFRLWWLTMADVIDMLARTGRPELAIAIEAKYHFADTVSLKDGLGRGLGRKILTTQGLLAGSLVRCDCGPDPLSMVLALPSRGDRLGKGHVLYARRHDVEGLMKLLTSELGDLEGIEDETQREWVGHAFGLMARELPLRDVPAFLQMRPTWLTVQDFRGSDYGSALARAVDAGDRDAVAALVELQARDDIVWLSAGAVSAPDAAAKVADLLPKLERDNLLLMRTKLLIERGDARKAVDELMNSSAADVWREPELDPGDDAAFDVFVLEPLLAHGAFDVAEEATRYLGEKDAREGKLERIATAREEQADGVEPKGAAAMLAEHWNAYRQTEETTPDPGQMFLFAVRDLLHSQPDAFPFE